LKRPFGVTLLGVLLLLQGLGLCAQAAAEIWLRFAPKSSLRSVISHDVAGLMVNDWQAIVVVGLLGIFSLAAGVGLFRLHPWAWFVAMVLQGWTLATLLLSYFIAGVHNYVNMLLGSVIVFYLNTRAVHETFDRARRHAESELSAPPATHPVAIASNQTPSLPARGAPHASYSPKHKRRRRPTIGNRTAHA
jgi:hypothetical protein